MKLIRLLTKTLTVPTTGMFLLSQLRLRTQSRFHWLIPDETNMTINQKQKPLAVLTTGLIISLNLT